MWIASEKGYTTIVQALLDAGADVDTLTNVCLLLQAVSKGNSNSHFASVKGWTALHQASWWGRTGAVQALINAKSDVNKLTEVSRC